MKLKGKVAIVTGGSRGIGKTVAEFLLKEGAQVVIMARDRLELSSAAKDIKARTRFRPIAIPCDVSRAPAVRRAVARAHRRLGRIDIVVNAAGIQAPIGPFEENIMEVWEKDVIINLFGTARIIHAALPFMEAGGTIINFSGGGATSSRPNFSAYAAAKAGGLRFTEVLSDELKTRGIRVNSVAPGAVNTSMLTEVLAAGMRAGVKEFNEATKRVAEGGVPPERAAELVVFLASEASAPLSGRLVSAVWDDWKSWDKAKLEAIMASDSLTLRRAK